MGDEAIEESRLDLRREVKFEKGTRRFCNDGNEMFSPLLGRCNWVTYQAVTCHISSTARAFIRATARSHYVAIYGRVHEANGR